ncbi:hypothetical protein MD484_g4148, partial [Candolleomyces efflorescens]
MSLSKKKKEAIGDALDTMDGRQVDWTWGPNWTAAHNSNTSQLGGYKPASRQDSTDPGHYWVAMFPSNNKSIKPPPSVQAEFATEPTTAQAVAGMRDVLNGDHVDTQTAKQDLGGSTQEAPTQEAPAHSPIADSFPQDLIMPTEPAANTAADTAALCNHDVGTTANLGSASKKFKRNRNGR